MRSINPRIKREGDTVAVMIEIYCHKHHTNKELCPECSRLLEYARQRLDKCPFQEAR